MKAIYLYMGIHPVLKDLDIEFKKGYKIHFEDDEKIELIYLDEEIQEINTFYKTKSSAEKEILDQYSYKKCKIDQDTKNALDQLKDIGC